MADSKITDLDNIVSVLGMLPPETVLYGVYAGDDYKVTVGQILALVSVGATALTQLTDTPNSYTGHAKKLLRVNPSANGVDFISADDLQQSPIKTYGTITVTESGGDYTAEIKDWVLQGDIAQDPDPETLPVEPATEEYFRVDRVQLHATTGAPYIGVGAEGEESATPPSQLAGYETIGYIYWFGNTAAVQSTSTGLVTKASHQANYIFGSGVINNLYVNRKNRYIIAGTQTEIRGIHTVGLIEDYDEPYDGRPTIIENRTGGPLKIAHNHSSGEEKFSIGSETDLIIPDKHVASFYWDSTNHRYVHVSSSANGSATGDDYILQYGMITQFSFLAAWSDYKLDFGGATVEVVPDMVMYSPTDTGKTRIDRVEVLSDGTVSLVTGSETTGTPQKPAETPGNKTIGFIYVSENQERWVPLVLGSVTKDSQQFYPVYGAGAVTLPIVDNYNYLLQAGVTQVDGIDSLLPAFPHVVREGETMSIYNATGASVLIKADGGFIFPGAEDFILQPNHFAYFTFLDAWPIFSGTSYRPRVPRIVYASTEYGAEITGTGNQIIHAFKFSPDTHPTKPGDKITVRITMTKTGTSDSVPMYIFHNDTVNLAGADQLAQAANGTGTRAPFIKRTFELQADGYIDMIAAANNANSDEGTGTSPRTRLQVWDYDGDNYLLIVVNRSGTSDTLYPTGYEVEIK
jgi:hypothetical protein